LNTIAEPGNLTSSFCTSFHGGCHNGSIKPGAANFNGKAVAVGATAGFVGVRTTGGLVATTGGLVAGTVVGTVEVTGTVGIGVSVGCAGVAVGGSGVGVMTTVMTNGG
jgi:hypothetical protein